MTLNLALKPLFLLLFLSFVSSCSQLMLNGDESRFAITPLISDNMVLQRNTLVKVWGEAAPGTDIQIDASWGVRQDIEADKNGEWESGLSTPQAGGPYYIAFNADGKKDTIKNVLIGEVWVASGQSNMAMPLKGFSPNQQVENGLIEAQQANNQQIRYFHTDYSYSRTKMRSVTGRWKVLKPDVAENMSAVAYHFAIRLQEELKVPIGIIESTWSGTSIENWMSQNKLRDLNIETDALNLLNDNVQYQKSHAWFSKRPRIQKPDNSEGWEKINLNDVHFASPDFDRSSWKTIRFPGRYDYINQEAIDGAFWITKEITLSDLSSDFHLKVGAIDDMEEVYINGKSVGRWMGWGFHNMTRDYLIPSAILNKGKNLIAIRIFDIGGSGAIVEPIQFTSEDGQAYNLQGDWRILPVAEIYEDNIYTYTTKDVDLRKRPKVFILNQYAPSALYNGMIHPLTNQAVAGVLWYQGESNVENADQYELLLTGLIQDWRTSWDQEIPFYVVQIAPYNFEKGEAPVVREAQRQVSEKMQGVEMISTLDVGDPNLIHPANKKEVGERLANAALNKNYSVSIPYTGPTVLGIHKKGKNLYIDFEHTYGGLTAKGKLVEFEIAGKDQRFYPAYARIVNNQLILSSAKVTNPVSARYAWSNAPTASLFNNALLPAAPFWVSLKTDI